MSYFIPPASDSTTPIFTLTEVDTKEFVNYAAQYLRKAHSTLCATAFRESSANDLLSYAAALFGAENFSTIRADDAVIERTPDLYDEAASFYILKAIECFRFEGNLEAGFKISALMTKLFGQEGSRAVQEKQAQLMDPSYAEEVKAGLRARQQARDEQEAMDALHRERLVKDAERRVQGFVEYADRYEDALGELQEQVEESRRRAAEEAAAHAEENRAELSEEEDGVFSDGEENGSEADSVFSDNAF